MQLGLAVLVQVLALSVWFSTAAVVPSLIAAWDISSGAASWLTTAVQVGFVVGAVTSALLNLADRVPMRWLIAGSAALAALSTALLPALADGLAVAIPLRFLTGFALAGVYPVGVKLVATWFAGARGLAIGLLLAALTLGSALPHLVTAFAELPWEAVLLVTAGLALGAAAVALLARDGPATSPSAPLHPRYLLTMFGDRAQRDVNLGYFGHMWELYAFWTWLASFVGAALLSSSGEEAGRTALGLATFATAGLAGAAGCVLAGISTLRRDPIAFARLSLAASAACCALSPLAFGAPAALMLAVVAVWSFFVIADSPMFSTALSQAADRRYVGTALTAQLAIGFLITAVAIRLVPLLADQLGWRWAFFFLFPGPLLGFFATRDLAGGAARLKPGRGAGACRGGGRSASASARCRPGRRPGR
ncbi:MAG: MFS transporter [Solirubrobacterales bacterium]